MFNTYELRWFYPGKVPEATQNWFEEDCLTTKMSQPEEREDFYLYSPSADYLGIKLRQGGLEVKWRTADDQMIFGSNVEGRAEKWSKWRCHDSTGESFLIQQVLNDSAWVSIRKYRHSQLYTTTAEFLPQPVAREDIVNGCTVELTYITIEENTWWSLSFEAFGDHTFLWSNLQKTANYLFDSYHGSKLIAANSYGYPGWLSKCF